MLFVTGTYLAPLLDAARLRQGALLRRAYAPVCHQQAERSVLIGGSPQAVCARCAGLYLGGATGLLAAIGFVRSRRRLRPMWLGLALGPTVLEGSLAWVGPYGLSNLPRLLLAWPAGLLAGMFLAVGVADLFAPSAGRSVRSPERSPQPRYLEELDG